MGFLLPVWSSIFYASPTKVLAERLSVSSRQLFYTQVIELYATKMRVDLWCTFGNDFHEQKEQSTAFTVNSIAIYVESTCPLCHQALAIYGFQRVKTIKPLGFTAGREFYVAHHVDNVLGALHRLRSLYALHGIRDDQRRDSINLSTKQSSLLGWRTPHQQGGNSLARLIEVDLKRFFVDQWALIIELSWRHRSTIDDGDDESFNSRPILHKTVHILFPLQKQSRFIFESRQLPDEYWIKHYFSVISRLQT